MRIALFGGGNKGSVVLKKLIELQEDVVGVFYFDEDKHETIWHDKIDSVAMAVGIPSVISHSITTDEVTKFLERMNPEVIFVAGWRYKIPQEQYSIPTKGCIVFHDSLLPKYRGFAPMNWAIINGEKQTGATMFFIADEIDSGDIIAQGRRRIGVLDTAETLEREFADFYGVMLESTLPLIKSGNVKRIPQDHSKATYTCKRIPDDGLIDWSQSSMQIYNLIRGLSYPYPNAFSYIDGQKVFIKEARLIESKKYVGRILGRVININGEWVEVLTGDGSLIVKADGWGKSIKTTFRSCK